MRPRLGAAVLAAVTAATALVAVSGPPSRATPSHAAHAAPRLALASVTNTGFVTRSGTHLLLNGHRFRFTGVNIYNANSRNNCWYTLGSGSALSQSLSQVRRGQEVFRAWFFQSEATRNGVRDWSAFDHTLAAAKAAGLRVIPVLVNQWGQCETWKNYADGYKSESWYRSGYRLKPTSPGMPNTYRRWVRQVVTRYRNNPTIMAWQMVNEAEDKTRYGGGCSSTAPASLRSFAADISGLIKSIDKRHLVSIGTIGTGQCGSSGSAYKTLHALPKVDLCEYHDYQPGAMPGDRWNGLATRLAQCAALHKPLFVGESGIRTSGSLSPVQRAAIVGRKLTAQMTAGVVGELLWDWRNAAHGGTADAGYEIGPADPALAVLAAH